MVSVASFGMPVNVEIKRADKINALTGGIGAPSVAPLELKRGPKTVAACTSWITRWHSP